LLFIYDLLFIRLFVYRLFIDYVLFIYAFFVSQNLANRMLQISVGTTCTRPEQIDVMALAGYSRPMYNKLVH